MSKVFIGIISYLGKDVPFRESRVQMHQKQLKDIAEDLKISLRKAIDYLTELENFGLAGQHHGGEDGDKVIHKNDLQVRIGLR